MACALVKSVLEMSHCQKSMWPRVICAPQRVGTKSLKNHCGEDPVCFLCTMSAYACRCLLQMVCVCVCAFMCLRTRATLDSRPTQQLLITLTEKSLFVSSPINTDFLLSSHCSFAVMVQHLRLFSAMPHFFFLSRWPVTLRQLSAPAWTEILLSSRHFTTHLSPSILSFFLSFNSAEPLW